MEPEKKEALIAQLSSAHEEDRRQAMEELKGDLSESDIAWLIRPLSDESWRVRKESIEGIAQLPPTHQLVASLIPLMDPGEELTLRNSVVEILERQGHDVAVILLKHLDIDQPDVRKFLVDILGNIAHPDTVPGLVGLLADPEDNIRAAASEALAAIGDSSVCGRLMTAIEGADNWVVYSILGSLAQLKCREALPVFFQYLGDHLLSKPALSGIGGMGSVEDGIRLMEKIPTLSKGAAKSAFLAAGSIYRRHLIGGTIESAKILKEAVSLASDEHVRSNLISQLEVSDEIEIQKDIIAVLGMTGSEDVLEPILSFVEEDALAWDVDLALVTLGQAQVSLIKGLLNHQDHLVRQRGVRTLQSLGSAESLEDVYMLLEDASGHVRKEAAIAVSRLGDSRSIDRLLPMLEDEYNDVAQSAAQAIVQLGQNSPEDLADRINGMLLTASPDLYSLLIMILAEVQAPGWEELCLKAAQDTEPKVRAAAIRCLKLSGNPSAGATIINALADESPQVRVQAAVTLEELKHPEAIAPLKAAMFDQDPWVRSSAVSALSAHPGAAPADFKELLASEDQMMRTSGLEALGRMAAEGSEIALGMIREQFETGTVEMKRSICRLLGKIAGTGAFDLLKVALTDSDPGIRIFAVHALAQREEAVIPEILNEAAEKDQDKQVRETIRSALEGRG